MTTATPATGTRAMETAGAESELRAAARRRGLTMRELAALMGVSAGHLSQIATGAGHGLRRCERRLRRCWERSPARGSSTAGAAW